MVPKQTNIIYVEQKQAQENFTFKKKFYKLGLDRSEVLRTEFFHLNSVQTPLTMPRPIESPGGESNSGFQALEFLLALRPGKRL